MALSLMPGPRACRLALLLLAAAVPLPAQSRRDVILSTTTSTYDTGLLDSLMPRFEKECRCRVKTIAVGSGAALALGGRGEADVVLAHAPSVELRYVGEGTLRNRRLVMTNDFIIVGPPTDPAGLRNIKQLKQAYQRLAEGKAPFVSRGDSSGTSILELNQWKAAGIRPDGAWYLQAGQGMAATLRIASEKQGYTLTDRGTFLATRKDLELAIVSEGAPELLNIYHVLEVNGDIFPDANAAGGRALADFLVRKDVQDYIATFGVAKFGQPLFTPQAGKREQDLTAPAR